MRLPSCRHIYMHIYIYIYIRIYIHIYSIHVGYLDIHILKQRCWWVARRRLCDFHLADTCAPPVDCVFVWAHAWCRECVCVHSRARVCVCVCVCVDMHVCVNTCIRTYIVCILQPYSLRKRKRERQCVCVPYGLYQKPLVAFESCMQVCMHVCMHACNCARTCKSTFEWKYLHTCTHLNKTLIKCHCI